MVPLLYSCYKAIMFYITCWKLITWSPAHKPLTLRLKPISKFKFKFIKWNICLQIEFLCLFAELLFSISFLWMCDAEKKVGVTTSELVWNRGEYWLLIIFFTLSSSKNAFCFYPPPPLFPTSLIRIIVELIHKYIIYRFSQG